MDENGKKFALTLVLWLIGIACLFCLIIFFLVLAGGFFSMSGGNPR